MANSEGNPYTCQIVFPSGRRGVTKTIAYYLHRTRERIPTRASITLADNRMFIRGTGYDGRCAFCSQFRRELKNRNIPFNCTCPREIGDDTCTRRVKIGGIFFNLAFLEDEKKYRSYLHRAENDPRDLEAHLALGLIHEYHGRFAPALASYWAAHTLDPGDDFIKERLHDILSLLQQILFSTQPQTGRTRLPGDSKFAPPDNVMPW